MVWCTVVVRELARGVGPVAAGGRLWGCSACWWWAFGRLAIFFCLAEVGSRVVSALRWPRVVSGWLWWFVLVLGRGSVSLCVLLAFLFFSVRLASWLDLLVVGCYFWSGVFKTCCCEVL